jgi:hypothetical protein
LQRELAIADCSGYSLDIGSGNIKTTIPANNFSLKHCVFIADTKKAACAARF